MKTLNEHMAEFDTQYPDYEGSTIRDRVANVIDNLIYDADHGDEYAIEQLGDLDLKRIDIFCECSQCERNSPDPVNWQECYARDDVVYSSECYGRYRESFDYEDARNAVSDAIRGTDFNYTAPLRGHFHLVHKLVGDEWVERVVCVEFDGCARMCDDAELETNKELVGLRKFYENYCQVSLRKAASAVLKRFGYVKENPGWYDSSDYYEQKDTGRKFRVSNHRVPQTRERMYNVENGGFSWCESDMQVILEDDTTESNVEQQIVKMFADDDDED